MTKNSIFSDHKDINKLLNIHFDLRWVNKNENQQNKPVHKNSMLVPIIVQYPHIFDTSYNISTRRYEFCGISKYDDNDLQKSVFLSIYVLEHSFLKLQADVSLHILLSCLDNLYAA